MAQQTPVQFLLEQGQAFLQSGQYAEALNAFQQATRLDRKGADGYVGLRRTCLRMPNRRLDAREVLRTAVKLNPSNANAQYYLGLSYVDQKKQSTLISGAEDGRTFFQKTIALDAGHPDAYYRLAQCYENASVPDFDKALPLYIRQLMVTPDHANARTAFV